MTRLLPEELKDKNYYPRPKHEQDSIWHHLVAQGLRVDITSAQRKVEELRALPLRERLVGAARLLADVSAGFIPYDHDGNRMNYRGPAPFLATDSNTVKLSGTTYTQRAYWITLLSKLCDDDFLVREGLSAANPHDWKGTSVEFSTFDIFRGVYIPPEIDAETAQALGIVQADGIVKRGFGLVLTGRTSDVSFYQRVVPIVFAAAFNLVNEHPYMISRESNLAGQKTYRYKYPVATYNSKALTLYLESLGFPTRREEANRKRIPKKVRDLPDELKEPFIKFYLGAKAHIKQNVGRYPYLDVLSGSEIELKDVKDILDDLGMVNSIVSIRPQGNIYCLYIGSESVQKMWRAGMLGENYHLGSELRERLRRSGYRPRRRLLLQEIVDKH